MKALNLRLTMTLILGLMIFSSAQATTFNFSYTFDTTPGLSGVVDGTFDGDANGNLITNLTNIFANWNGNSFNGSGSLYGGHFDAGWQSGGAIASFDGTQNNFLFIDSDYPISTSYSNFIFSVPNDGSLLTNSVHAYFPTDIAFEPYNATHWSVTPVPEPSTMLLLGSGLLGLAWYGRKRKKALH